VFENRAGGLFWPSAFFHFLMFVHEKPQLMPHARHPEYKHKPARSSARRALSLPFGFPFCRQPQSDRQAVSRLFIQESS
jgi:hypothetical protein